MIDETPSACDACRRIVSGEFSELTQVQGKFLCFACAAIPPIHRRLIGRLIRPMHILACLAVGVIATGVVLVAGTIALAKILLHLSEPVSDGIVRFVAYVPGGALAAGMAGIVMLVPLLVVSVAFGVALSGFLWPKKSVPPKAPARQVGHG